MNFDIFLNTLTPQHQKPEKKQKRLRSPTKHQSLRSKDIDSRCLDGPWMIPGSKKRRFSNENHIKIIENWIKEAMICFFLDSGRNLQSRTPPNMAAKAFCECKKSILWFCGGEKSGEFSGSLRRFEISDLGNVVVF